MTQPTSVGMPGNRLLAVLAVIQSSQRPLTVAKIHHEVELLSGWKLCQGTVGHDLETLREVGMVVCEFACGELYWSGA